MLGGSNIIHLYVSSAIFFSIINPNQAEVAFRSQKTLAAPALEWL